MRFYFVVLLSSLLTLPAYGQGIMEFGDLRAGAAGTGAGAGMSAGLGHKNAVNKSFGKVVKTMTAAQRKAFDVQSQAINKYWSSGCKYELSRQWSNAEMAFAYVLQVVTLRDGAQSTSRVPVLQKLVRVTKAQKKLDQAVTYQKSIVTFQKQTKNPDERVIVKSQDDLTNLYLDKHDYAAAEPVLKDSLALFNKYPTLPKQQKLVTLKTYGIVLRKLKKNAEADKIEKAIAPSVPMVPTNAVQAMPPSTAEPTPIPVMKTPDATTTPAVTSETGLLDTTQGAPVKEADPLPPQVTLPPTEQPVEPKADTSQENAIVKPTEK